MSTEVDPELYAREYEAFRRSPEWELNNITRALNMLPALNGPAESARLAAIRTIRRERKS